MKTPKKKEVLIQGTTSSKLFFTEELLSDQKFKLSIFMKKATRNSGRRQLMKNSRR
jgi:hypothetical protein